MGQPGRYAENVLSCEASAATRYGRRSRENLRYLRVFQRPRQQDGRRWFFELFLVAWLEISQRVDDLRLRSVSLRRAQRAGEGGGVIYARRRDANHD